MTKDEALKQALVALEDISTALREDDVLGSDIELMLNAAAAIRVALAQPASGYAKKIEELIQERDALRALAQPDERNFCPRCGKRTADLTTIHTQGNT